MNRKLKKELKKYIDLSNNEVNKVFETIDYDEIIKVKDVIKQAKDSNKRVHVTGIGKPGHVASYVASLLSSIGTPTYVLNGTEAVHGSAGQVMKGDVVIAISNSGQTEELKSTIVTLKNNKAIVVGVSGNANSWLAENSNYFLYAGVKQEGDRLNKPPRSSIIAEIIVLQCLSVVLQYEENITPETYVKWHPGGALGKSITENKNGN